MYRKSYGGGADVMSYVLDMTRDEAESVINVVCWRLKISYPKVSWHGTVRNGYYGCGTIHIGPKLWRGLDGVLHEIAHHVVYCLFKDAGKTRRILPHGKEFQASLNAVAKLWGSYNWNNEYRQLRGKAIK